MKRVLAVDILREHSQFVKTANAQPHGKIFYIKSKSVSDLAFSILVEREEEAIADDKIFNKEMGNIIPAGD